MEFCQYSYTKILDLNSAQIINPCWTDVIFSILCFAQILIFGALKILFTRNLPKNPIFSLRTNIAILIAQTISLFSTIAYYISIILLPNDRFVIGYNISISMCLIILASILTPCLYLFECSKEQYSPGFTFFWQYFIQLIRSAFIFNAYIQTFGFSNIFSAHPSVITALLHIIIVLFTLILTAFSPRKIPQGTFLSLSYTQDVSKHAQNATSISNTTRNQFSEDKHYKQREASASIMSLLTFDWLTGLLCRGFKRQIKQEDFYNMKSETRSTILTSKFMSHKKSQSYTKYNFIKILLQSFGYEFYFAAILKLFSDLVLFINPWIMPRIIKFIENPLANSSQGYLYCAALFFATILSSFLLNQYFLRVFRVGLKVKVCIMSLLYRKSLQISASEKQKQTTGEIVNLMSVDTDRFMELFPYFHILWSGPLQIFLGCYFLWQQVGISTLIGMAIMLLCMIPGNTIVVRQIKKTQKKIMESKDERIKVTNEALAAMKVIKLYGWEKSFKDKISRIRGEEMHFLRHYAYYNSINTCIWNTTSIFVALGVFLYYTLIQKGDLTAGKAFTTITLLNIIRFPLSMFPSVLNSTVIALVSLKRFIAFLNRKNIENQNEFPIFDKNIENSCDIFVKDCVFYWDSECNKKAFEIPETLAIKRASLTMISGSVGSGKSALLQALLGELNRKQTVFSVNPEIAYVAQSAWIRNATIKENILFGSKFDRERYNAVIQACCLEQDLKFIYGGSNAEIGERGINLSGGQKQRVALARAVYKDKSVYLLDDPLSAVDSHVAKHILENCILKLLKNKTVVFVTNAQNILKFADQVLFIKKGKIDRTCSCKEVSALLSNEEKKSDNVSQINEGKQILLNIETERTELVRRSISQSQQEETVKLITIEDREKGKIKLRIYFKYILSIGIALYALIFMSFVLRQASDYGVKRVLALWTDSLQTNEANRYILYYSLISLLSISIIIFNTFIHPVGYLRASRRISKKLLFSILRAPMSFFDTTPKGRILNRFSSDINFLDTSIPMSFFHFLTCMCEVSMILIVICIITPWFTLALIPIAAFYYAIQIFFLKPTRDIKRWTSVLVSPIYSQFGETLEGISTIRAFRKETEFLQSNDAKIDACASTYYSGLIANRWLSLRLDMLGTLVITISTIMLVLNRNRLSGGISGLILSYCFRFVPALNWMIRSFSILENQIVSVERIVEYTEIPSEAELETPVDAELLEWPEAGKIELKNLGMKYRPELDFTIRDISAVIQSREKIGIVGRTGAGKSSLFNCLFRVNEATLGSILVDEVDISTVGLQKLRTRMTIIPQDPVLFTGSIRFNLDPFDNCTDEEIWKATEMCQVADVIRGLEDSGKSELDFEVAEEGSNLSAGQRQLLCICRALLRKSKILFLDEATSSIDYQTDQLIQEIIKKVFSDCTVLTIAHRVDTIMDSDRIIVMDKGRIVEFDTPEKLLKDDKSIFFDIMRKTK